MKMLNIYREATYTIKAKVTAKVTVKVKVKVKFILCLINYSLPHELVWGSGGIASAFLTSALAGGEWSASATLPSE
jgi:hypothetical protein